METDASEESPGSHDPVAMLEVKTEMDSAEETPDLHDQLMTSEVKIEIDVAEEMPKPWATQDPALDDG